MKISVGILTVAFIMSAGTVQAGSLSLTPSDVATHNTRQDCWMVIENKVYDVTDYLLKHPAPQLPLADYCGKDATEGWRTKGKIGKPHSKKAEILLKSMLKGLLKNGGH